MVCVLLSDDDGDGDGVGDGDGGDHQPCSSQLVIPALLGLSTDFYWVSSYRDLLPHDLHKIISCKEKQATGLSLRFSAEFPVESVSGLREMGNPEAQSHRLSALCLGTEVL